MIDPKGMTLRDWSDSVQLALGDAWSVGKLVDEARWQDWAVAFARASQRNVPDPYQFADWREWAMRAYPMLEAAS